MFILLNFDKNLLITFLFIFINKNVNNLFIINILL